MRYRGTVAMVTGAGSGIGRATAERLAVEGAAVAVVDVDIAAADQVVDAITSAGGTALALSFDVGDREAFETASKEVTKELGDIGVLVNNAGIGAAGGITAWNEEDLQRVLGVNLNGVLHGMGIVGAAMTAGNGGAIVNMASLAGIHGTPGMTPYTASKGAVVALTRAAAMELAPKVRVNAIAPGKIVTPMRAKIFGSDLTDADLAAIAETYPLRKVGAPEDIAAAVAFLGGPDAAFITGIVLTVDGGFTAGLNLGKI